MTLLTLCWIMIYVGNYLMALNASRWLNLTNQADFDARLNKFLTSLSSLKLFEDALPNKVYNAATGQMVDYGNNPIERGIGWSALDIGRVLAAFDVIRTCHPQYNEWLTGIVSKWQVARSLKDEQLFGATVLPDNKTFLVQEGRLGYEEYGARGYELWGFKAPKAISLEPFKMVEINGVQIPVDTRDFQSTNANNYVISESYILDGIEFGLQGDLADFAARVLDVQKRRYDTTGQLTAVTEDNIDQAPYFLYNTVYANGANWATITVTKDNGRNLTRINPETLLGYEEYAARAFQLWGFNLERSAVGGEYQTTSVEGMQIPIQRRRTDTKSQVNQYTVSNPFLLYALEFGLDPKMRSLFEPIFQAQAKRYERTNTLTASATTLIDRKPYTIHSTISGQGKSWVALGDDGQIVPKGRLVSTAVAFAYHALLPENKYSQKLLQGTADLYNPLIGFYEGFYETTGKTAIGFTSSTNSMILQSLLYRVMNRQPLIRPAVAKKSPWWQAVNQSDSGRGLPSNITHKSKLVSDSSGTYWVSGNESSIPVSATRNKK